MLVMKFGGTSVGDAQCFRRVKDLVAQAARDRAPVVVVVSAMSTVTETLLEAARRAVAGNPQGVAEKLDYLEQKHLKTADELFTGSQRQAAHKAVSEIVAEFRRICSGMELLRELSLRAMDAGLSTGERLSATLLALFLKDQGIPAETVDAAKCLVT